MKSARQEASPDFASEVQSELDKYLCYVKECDSLLGRNYLHNADDQAWVPIRYGLHGFMMLRDSIGTEKQGGFRVESDETLLEAVKRSAREVQLAIEWMDHGRQGAYIPQRRGIAAVGWMLENASDFPSLEILLDRLKKYSPGKLSDFQDTYFATLAKK